MKFAWCWVVAGALVGATSCSPRGRDLDIVTKTARTEALMRQYPCTSIPSIEITPTRPVTAAEACAVVRRALQAIAAGGGRDIGLVAGDTAKVRAVAVSDAHYEGLAGAPDSRHWLLSMVIPGRDPDIHVEVDQLSDSVAVANGEPAHATIIYPDSGQR